MTMEVERQSYNEILQNLQGFIGDLFSMYLDIEDDQFRDLSDFVKDQSLLSDFFYNADSRHLFILYRNSKIELTNKLSDLTNGHCFIIYKSKQFLQSDQVYEDQYIIANIQFHYFGYLSKAMKYQEFTNFLLKNSMGVVISSILEQIEVPYQNKENEFFHKNQQEKEYLEITKKKIHEICLCEKEKRDENDLVQIVLPIDNSVINYCRRVIASEKYLKLVEFPEDIMNKDAFLSILSENVKKWYSVTNTLINHSNNTNFELLSEEIFYWKRYISVLQDLQQQLSQPEIKVTFEILKAKRKINKNMDISQEVGLQQKIETVQSFIDLFKDIPVDQLMAPISITDSSAMVTSIFSYIRKLFNNQNYSSGMCLRLIENFSNEITINIVGEITKMNLVDKEASVLEQILGDLKRQLVMTWNHQMSQMKEFFSQTLGNDPTRINTLNYKLKHNRLFERLRVIFNCKEVQENIYKIYFELFSKQSVKPKDQTVVNIKNFFSVCFGGDIFDLSSAGDRQVEESKKRFNEMIVNVEKDVIIKIRDTMGLTKNKTEMFKIFEQYASLMKRPNIRSSLQEYQNKLIKELFDEASSQFNKFRKGFGVSSSKDIFRAYQIPSKAGSYFWREQIKNSIFKAKEKIEVVLGDKLKSHSKGLEYEKFFEDFKRLYESDPEDQQLNTEFNFTGKMLALENKGGALQVRVNFSSEQKTSLENFRCLIKLKFNNKTHIQNKFYFKKNAWPIYLNALSLTDSIDNWNLLIRKIDVRIVTLIGGHMNYIYQLLSKGFEYEWSTKEYVDEEQSKYQQTLNTSIEDLQQSVEYLNLKFQVIDENIEQLAKSDIKDNKFETFLSNIQNVVDQLNIKKYNGLEFLIEELNERIEKVFVKRSAEMIQQWNEELVNYKNEKKSKSKNRILSSVIEHEICLRDLKIYVSPPIQHAKQTLFKSLHNLIQTFSQCPKILLNRFNLIESERAKESSNFQNLIFKIPKDILINAYRSINDLYERSLAYTTQWTSYQSIWEIEVDDISSSLGTDVKKWQEVITEIKRGRSTFDSSEFSIAFGPIVVNYKQIQMKITSVYDGVYKLVLNKFGEIYCREYTGLCQTISEHKDIIERLELSNMSEVIDNISIINFCKKNILDWEMALYQGIEIEKNLNSQKYHFSSNFRSVISFQKDFQKFKSVFQSKNHVFESNIDKIKESIFKDEETLLKTLSDLEIGWATDRPCSPTINCVDALYTINVAEQKVNDVKTKIDSINKAKDLMGIIKGGFESVDIILTDIESLKTIWEIVREKWQTIEETGQDLFIEINPIQFGKALDSMIESLQETSRTFKGDPVLLGKRKELQNIKRKNKLIIELKTEAMKEKHLKQVFAKIKILKSMEEIRVRELLEIDTDFFEKSVNDIIALAQGELILESMLKKIKEFWSKENFTFIQYSTEKIHLIKGWDELIAKIDEDFAQLTNMKISQYFKTFESEIKTWLEKIQEMSSVIEKWMDVQKKWIYLEAIFKGSQDIKTQLPHDSEHFEVVSKEFVQILSHAYKKQRVSEAILSNPSLGNSLASILATLEKIQKALSDYLENQRQLFARFYFIGDDDLLEIIGNSKELVNIQKFFSKMFSGINSVGDSGNKVIESIASKELEIIPLNSKIDILKFNKIYLWLQSLEDQTVISLISLNSNCLQEWSKKSKNIINDIVSNYPAQIIILSFIVYWTHLVEESIASNSVGKVCELLDEYLKNMAEVVLQEIPPLVRKKYEHLITEIVHKRNVSRELLIKGVTNVMSFGWMFNMRFYSDTNSSTAEVLSRIGNSEFKYGFEYLGFTDKLVQTPLTDKCFYTLTMALALRMGGAPFGPAGTGKTESVKALGNSLGRFTLVFNCDEAFNFAAMGRIFIGLCQVGAFGCFDEFNRLEERILSAVSQQILIIQTGLRESKSSIVILDRKVGLNFNMGIFVTMNPGYAGRSNLPENLKQLFRQVAMIKPDSSLIAQVMLFSQGFKMAENLSDKIVSLFELCLNQLSSQSHYDFGLRALKSVLNSAGSLKRKSIALENPSDPHSLDFEQGIILRSFCDTIIPKLVSEDVPLLNSLIKGVFPTAIISNLNEEKLLKCIYNQCDQLFLNKEAQFFIEKALQLNQIMTLVHGVMLVGPTGSGKSASWQVLLNSLNELERVKSDFYVIDPKALSKEELYGKLDSTTMEWTDGIFTFILRKILDNQKGELTRRQWIIFDGDVDPEWAENLNSVLDDNKILTLPNGERLKLTPNIKLLFEVESLKYATLATVSRCGMIWFSEEVLSDNHIFSYFLQKLKQSNFDAKQKSSSESLVDNPVSKLRERCVDFIESMFISESGVSFVSRALVLARKYNHVMEFSRIRVIESLMTLLRKGVDTVVEMDEMKFGNYSKNEAVVRKYMINWVLVTLNWSFVGDLKLEERYKYYDELRTSFFDGKDGFEFPSLKSNSSIIDYDVSIEDGELVSWKSKVPVMEINMDRVTNADTIIPTVDTIRHREFLCSWLKERRPFIICGPPGSGKTMTLMSTLKHLQDFEMIFVNFSSSTDPKLILKQFDHYCEYVKGPKGVVLRPKSPNKWLVVFCDEINLPDEDKYGTQIVITFLRQLTEQKGFWRVSDKQWISLERVQFVGACNPPTDSGRHPLGNRFLRHCPLILVDFPSFDSLIQIYGTFNRALFKKIPSLRAYADSLTNAMVEFYSESQKRFTSDQHPHYIYSPRELTRWKYAINEGIDFINSLEDLVRLWAHEAQRLFEDRLVEKEERTWCQLKIDEIASKHFSGLNQSALARPIIFSCYITKNYQSVGLPELKEYISEKLAQFNEEEFNVELVIFDEVVDHIIKIDRVLRQPIGHMLLVGSSGVGKTTLSKYVSWINGLKVFQIKAGRNYSIQNFDDDLREVMKRAGCRGEKITFIFDESNVLSVSFMERMNALLASGEIPGLFEGEELTSLVNSYNEFNGGARNRETSDEIYHNFIRNVQRNLHVIFTMNPNSPDFSNRSASSPAIFNRCVIDWFGDWSNDSLREVIKQLTSDLVSKTTIDPSTVTEVVFMIHESVRELNKLFKESAKRFNYITPRDLLEFIKHLKRLVQEKTQELVEQKNHLNKGLESMKETERTVSVLRGDLFKYDEELSLKKTEANEKLEMIMSQTKESGIRIEDSKKLSLEISIKKKEISESQEVVQRELNEVEPSLERAKKSVSSISSKDIAEVRGYANPNEKIKIPLEALFLLLKNKKIEWAEIKSEMTKSDFISSILNFDIFKISEATRLKLRSEYLSKSTWNLEAIYNSSKAVGPIAEWLQSQMEYSDILTKIKPLTEKIENLNLMSSELESKYTDLQRTILSLEDKIKTLKLEHGELVINSKQLSVEKDSVQNRLRRAENLINSLGLEKIRWTENLRDFDSHFKTVFGDCLFSAAFLTYLGYFDEYYRNQLMVGWRQLFRQSKIDIKQDLSLIEFLSNPLQRIQWQGLGLSSDDLSVQNTIVMNRFNRYPLVIDPSGQINEFLCKYLSGSKSGAEESKFIKTSFLDDGFFKQIETALRFGASILIQDVEKIEPILNSILNKEVIRQGGRNLVRLGDQEIDFSPSFNLFMITRNSNAFFTPDVCSRVTFVNFTVTKTSLENQLLSILLKNERPDIDKNRITLLKLQGEYLMRLRSLEKELLEELSNSQGSNLIENEAMFSKLENLKVESTKIEREKETSEKSLLENNEATAEYKTLANIGSSIFFVLQSFSVIDTMYQFSLKFFIKMVYLMLNNDPRLGAIPGSDFESRKVLLHTLIFDFLINKTLSFIREEDKLILLLKFGELFLEKNVSKEISSFFRHLYVSSDVVELTLNLGPASKDFEERHLIIVEVLSNLPLFDKFLESFKGNVSAWRSYIQNPESSPIDLGFLSKSAILADKSEAHKLILIQIGHLIVYRYFNSKEFIGGCLKLVNGVFRRQILDEWQLSIQSIVNEDTDSKVPVLLACAQGFDPTFKIRDVANVSNAQLTDIAIGSKESYDQATAMIEAGVKRGSWVLLKNVHLSVSWLKEFELKFYQTTPHPSFRLFLHSEFTNNLPDNILRESIKCFFELSSGVKDSIKRIYLMVYKKDQVNKHPLERSRLYFLLAWTHSVIMERLRYIPTGWSKYYEFSEADLKASTDILDDYIDRMGKKQNINIEEIQFEAITNTIVNNIYGGKVDNEFDLKILRSLVAHYISIQQFEPNRRVVSGQGTEFRNPESYSHSGVLDWLASLKTPETPEWSGLQKSSSAILENKQSEHLIKHLTSSSSRYEEYVSDLKLEKVDKQTSEGSFPKLDTVLKQAELYLNILSQQLQAIERNSNDLVDPIFRFLEREVTIASNIQSIVRESLNDLVAFIRLKTSISQNTKLLIDLIHSNTLPKSWLALYTVDTKISLSNWVKDFKARLVQLERVTLDKQWTAKKIEIGRFFFPEAFLIATKQLIALRLGVSLNELVMHVDFERNLKEETFFRLEKIWIQGANWTVNGLEYSDAIENEVHDLCFSWRRPLVQKLETSSIVIPIYLNSTRRHLLSVINVGLREKGPSETALYQRGISIIFWNN